MFFDRQQGATLIEVLVAVFILGLGIMGLVASQFRSLTEVRSLWWQWQAQTLASEMIERIRAADGQAVTLAVREDWRQRVAERLPNGKTSVRWPAGPGAEGVIILQWSATDPDSPEQVQLPFRP